MDSTNNNNNNNNQNDKDKKNSSEIMYTEYGKILNDVHYSFLSKNYYIILSSTRYLFILEHMIKKYYNTQESCKGYRVHVGKKTKAVIALLSKKYMTEDQLSFYFDYELPTTDAIIAMSDSNDIETMTIVGKLTTDILDFHIALLMKDYENTKERR